MCNSDWAYGQMTQTCLHQGKGLKTERVDLMLTPQPALRLQDTPTVTCTNCTLPAREGRCDERVLQW